MQLSWAVRTDPGLRRSSNEDSYCTRADLGLFVVADGMGGHAAGEVASRLAVETIETFIDETAGADKNRTWPFPFEPHAQPRRQPAEGRVPPRQPPDRQRDGRLRGPARHGDDRVRGAGRREAAACVGHVGDSRVYALRDGALRADHRRSLVGRGTGPRRHDDARPPRASIRGATSSRARCRAATIRKSTPSSSTPAPGERFLLCSDGLSGVVPHDAIAQIARRARRALDGDLRAADRRGQRGRRARQHHGPRAR